MMEFDGKKFLSEKEAAHLIGMSVSWMRLLRLKKETPGHIRLTPNGKVFYDFDNLNKWIKNRITKYTD